VPGADLSGVRPALDLLREVNGGGEAKLGRQVIVVGGGNTALDAARVAIRQGARATVVYRRSREEMPAHPDEVAQAEIEGVRFMFHAAPVRFQGWRGVVRSVLCQRMKPGAPDASGRRSPEPIPGDTFAIPCSDVLTAIGEELEQRAIDGVMEVARGRLAADRWGRTPMAPLFAGGDAATGAGTVVEAIGSGRRAAGAVHAWLTAGEVPPEPESPERVTVEQLNLVYFRLARRSHVPMLHYEVAVGGFREVAGGLDWGQAAAEAGRCLTCGSCTQCGNCVVFCPDAAVHPVGAGYEIDYAHCKGCGICVEECPRGAMALVAEEAR
jgi:NADPH-dependent glutamate synthase beta subunit-like oxidoreductase